MNINQKDRRFKDVVKEARVGLELTMREVAEKAGCHPSQVAEFESGKRLPPTGELLKHLCRTLKLPLKDIRQIAEKDRNSKPTSDEKVKRLFREKPDLAFALCREAEKLDDDDFLQRIIQEIRAKNNERSR